MIGWVALLLAALALTGISCAEVPKLPPEPPYVVFPADDAGTMSVSSADCRLACESLARVGCPEAAPANGQSCTQVCANAELLGFPLNTLAIANASNPDQMRAAGVRCEGVSWP